MGSPSVTSTASVADFKSHTMRRKRPVSETASLFGRLVCSVLHTCVWTAHHLPCFIYSSFTSQCERKTHSFTVCKETHHISGRVSKYIVFQTQECSTSHGDGRCVCRNRWRTFGPFLLHRFKDLRCVKLLKCLASCWRFILSLQKLSPRKSRETVKRKRSKSLSILAESSEMKYHFSQKWLAQF